MVGTLVSTLISKLCINNNLPSLGGADIPCNSCQEVCLDEFEGESQKLDNKPAE